MTTLLRVALQPLAMLLSGCESQQALHLSMWKRRNVDGSHDRAALREVPHDRAAIQVASLVAAYRIRTTDRDQ